MKTHTTSTSLELELSALVERPGMPSQPQKVLLRLDFDQPDTVVLNLRRHHTTQWVIDRARLVCALRGYPTEPNPEVARDGRIAQETDKVVVQRTSRAGVTTVRLPWAVVAFFLDLCQQRAGTP